MKVIYFDGVCNLCDGFISSLISLGLASDMRVTSLQGSYAQEHLPEKERAELSSVLYQTPHGIFRESAAVIYILADMKPYLVILKVFLIIPSFLRDGLYKAVAKNRYRLFGKKETCRLPSEEEKAFFI